jgi:L,D-transpeptidase catalytic domain
LERAAACFDSATFMRQPMAAVVLALVLLAGAAAGYQSPVSGALMERSRGPDSRVIIPAGYLPAAVTNVHQRPQWYLVLRAAPGRELILHSSPGGAVIARLDERTEFGSPQTVAVVRKRGRWFGVVTTHLPNGTLAWVDSRGGGLRYRRTRLNLVLDLSARKLVLRSGLQVIRRMTVGVGQPASPTPVGHFAITDKLSGPAFSSYYGCCILALSAHQPNLPAGWRGGDRIAIHGTYDLGSIGAASTAGCVRAQAVDLRILMRRLPLGTPVFIHA